MVPTKNLWQFDERVGVGLSADTRSAADGRLFTTRAVAMKKNVGFAVAVFTVPDATEPLAGGLLRLGGDGRAARISPVSIH